MSNIVICFVLVSSRTKPCETSTDKLCMVSCVVSVILLVIWIPWLGFQVDQRGGKDPKPNSKTHPLYKQEFPAQVPAARNEMDQADAKLFLPPGAYIWRLNKRGAWGTSIGKHHDHTEPFARHGNDSAKAMWACVKFSWLMYLEDKCLPKAHCPIAGLL